MGCRVWEKEGGGVGGQERWTLTHSVGYHVRSDTVFDSNALTVSSQRGVTFFCDFTSISLKASPWTRVTSYIPLRPGPNVEQAMKPAATQAPYASITTAKSHHQKIIKFLSRQIILRKKNKNESLTAYSVVHVNTL